MTRRKSSIKARIAIYSLGVAVIAIKTVGAQPSLQPARDSRKPNIVFMLTDNLGYGELGCYGRGIVRGAPRRASTSSRLKVRACSISMSRRNAHQAAQPF
jgi:hypothetical protein